MARLMDGYERSRGNALARRRLAAAARRLLLARRGHRAVPRLRLPAQAQRPAPPLRRRVHAHACIARLRHLRRYLPRIGLKRYATAGAILVHYTGYERPAESIPLNDTLLRRVGHMLGTADIIAQMSDRCYLEKCRDRLYPEFVLGGLAQQEAARRPHAGPVHLGRRPGAQDAGLLHERDEAARPAVRARLRVRRAPLRGAEPVPRGDAEERALRAGGRRRADHRDAAPRAAVAR